MVLLHLIQVIQSQYKVSYHVHLAVPKRKALREVCRAFHFIQKDMVYKLVVFLTQAADIAGDIEPLGEMILIHTIFRSDDPRHLPREYHIVVHPYSLEAGLLQAFPIHVIDSMLGYDSAPRITLSPERYG